MYLGLFANILIFLEMISFLLPFRAHSAIKRTVFSSGAQSARKDPTNSDLFSVYTGNTSISRYANDVICICIEREFLG